MQLHLVFDSSELDALNASADEAVAAAQSMETGAQGLDDVCGVVRQVLPVLKVAEKIACAIPFGPFKTICAALRTAIGLLEKICPG